MQGRALSRGQAVKGRFEFGLRQLQRLHAGGRQAVKALRVVKHRGIATLLHVGQDGSHALFDGSVRLGRPMQPRLEVRFKRSVTGGKPGRASLQGHGGSGSHGLGHGVDDAADRFLFELERGLVDNQARADVHDALDFDQVVGLERVAR